MNSGETADQVVRMTLNGTEMAARLTGTAAKEIAMLLYAVASDHKQSRGKTKLANLLRTGKELSVFAVKDADVKRFMEEAKKYGVLYCVLKDKDANDGITEIMAKAEDAAKINRIYDKLGMATVGIQDVRAQLEQSRITPEKEAERTPNPSGSRKSTSRSEPISTPENASAKASDRPSVRQELKEIKAAMEKVKSVPGREKAR